MTVTLVALHELFHVPRDRVPSPLLLVGQHPKVHVKDNPIKAQGGIVRHGLVPTKVSRMTCWAYGHVSSIQDVAKVHGRYADFYAVGLCSTD
jgi:hypothetical protein